LAASRGPDLAGAPRSWLLLAGARALAVADCVIVSASVVCLAWPLESAAAISAFRLARGVKLAKLFGAGEHDGPQCRSPHVLHFGASMTHYWHHFGTAVNAPRRHCSISTRGGDVLLSPTVTSCMCFAHRCVNEM